MKTDSHDIQAQLETIQRTKAALSRAETELYIAESDLQRSSIPISDHAYSMVRYYLNEALESFGELPGWIGDLTS